MGIRLTRLPDNIAASKLIENLDAHTVSVHIGSAVLTVQRLKDPVPTGAMLTDGPYRKALQQNFEDDFGPKVQGEATTISGQPAWAWFHAEHIAPLSFVEYTRVTYVIANEHPYRFIVHATGPYKPHEPDAKPVDFDAAVNAISDVAFEPVNGPSDSQAGLKIPRMSRVFVELYPDAAKARSEVGIVEVNFSIDGKGHAVEIQQTNASSPHLGNLIPRYLKAVTFKVPADWEEKGLSAHRFDMEFHFALVNAPQACGLAPEPRTPGAAVIFVCGSRIH